MCSPFPTDPRIGSYPKISITFCIFSGNRRQTLLTKKIPEIIHFCWFGEKPLPDLEEKCKRSWEQLLPHFEIKRWDENTFDITSHWFTRQAYHKGKYAFVSDYVRLHALKHYGGVYLDADTELVKSLDPFMNAPAFCGFQDEEYVSAGVLGTRPGSRWVDEMLEFYDSEQFKADKKSYFAVPNTVWFTRYLKKKGLKMNNSKQQAGELVIYPSHIFNPRRYDDPDYTIHKETVAIHHSALSWLPWYKKYRVMLKKYVVKKYFPRLLKPLSKIYTTFFRSLRQRKNKPSSSGYE